MEYCPPSPWNAVRDDAGTLSAISVESCPPSRGIRSDGEPGAKTLWLGMRDIAVFVQGSRYARELELAG